MAVLKILSYPNPRLKIAAPPVEDIHDPKVQKMIEDMLETLVNTPRCGGLAATQLDIKEPKRMFVFYDSEDSLSNPICVINPEIIETIGEVFEEEGCMSIYPAEITAKVRRPKRSKIRAINPKGETIELEREDYLAKLLVHECDHLDGKLYIDRLLPLKRRMVDKKISKIQKTK